MLKKSDGAVVEVLLICQGGRTLLAFEFGELAEAEQVAREILRLAEEWRLEKSTKIPE